MTAAMNLSRVILVTGPPGEPDDEAVDARLDMLGYEVVLSPCPDDLLEAKRYADGVKPREVSLVIISPTAPAVAGRAFRDLAVPTVAMGSRLYPEMGLTGTSPVNDFGEQSNETRLLVIDSNHPLAADLESSPDVAERPVAIEWGMPSKEAHTVVTLTTDIGRAVVFCYDHGDTMVGLNAPARRVGILYASDFARHVADNGNGFVSPYWRLFDAAVEWAASERPRQFSDVFRAEWAEVRARRRVWLPHEKAPSTQPQKSPPADLAGLALSGGGIRAATFSLGLLQGLHARGLLRHFDYLSTVSGGGYIGGWWSAWLSRDPRRQRGGADFFPPPELIKTKGDAPEAGDEGEPAGPSARPTIHGAFDEIQVVNTEVADELLSAGRDPAHHLRLFSNYLTPRKGMLSPDTWRAGTVIARNLALTWVVLLPVLIAALLLGKFYFVILQHNSWDVRSDDAFFLYTAHPQSDLLLYGTLATPAMLRARLLMTLWPLLVVLGWFVVSVGVWIINGGGSESRREWWAGKLGSAVVAVVLGLGLYPFFTSSGSTGVGAPLWVWAALPAGAVVLLAYFYYPTARLWILDRNVSNSDAARQWRGDVMLYRIARVQAKLAVIFVFTAFILLLGGFGHELVNYLTGDSGPVVKAGGWLAVLVTVGGSLFTAIKNSPSGGSDERLLDENQSFFNRLVFRVTPTLVLLLLAVALSWAASMLLNYIHATYLSDLRNVFQHDFADATDYLTARLEAIKGADDRPKMITLLTMATCFGLLLSFFLVMVETRWRNTTPQRWLAALWFVLACYLALMLGDMLFVAPTSPTHCAGQPVVNFLLQVRDYPDGVSQQPFDWRCVARLYVVLDRRAFGVIFFVSYITGWWLIFRLQAGERRRPRRMATPVLIALVGALLAILTVMCVERLYKVGRLQMAEQAAAAEAAGTAGEGDAGGETVFREKDSDDKPEQTWVELWLVIVLGGALLFCLLYAVLETTRGSSDNKRALWLLTSVYLVLNALLAISILADYSDLLTDQLASDNLTDARKAELFDFYVRVLVGQGAFGLFGAALTWVVAMGWMADPNRLSMHEFYRSRLVRAYLGASNNYRRQQLKTIREVVEGDDVRLQDLRNCRRGAPYHLVNTTLNLVGGRDLTTAQRSADAFVLSRRYCGSSRTGYRDTREYMGGRLSLGTAVAVSGAAASPNMGSKTLTSSLAMLMTFLNVRLGYWAPTPNKKDWRETKARLWPFYMLREFTSQTNDLSTYCYLTDGGHFDNTGLYALVERGCRLVVVADCGADPKPCFQDVGDALRRCRIDFGAEINLDLAPLMRSPDTALATSHFAVGSIVYSREHAKSLGWAQTPRNDRETHEEWKRRDELARTGVVVLLKPAITSRDEPADIRQYKLENSLFPQQTTVDQWFDEAQFESYRRLGEVCAGTLLKELKSPGVPYAPDAVAKLIREVSEKFDPHSPFSTSRQSASPGLAYVV